MKAKLSLAIIATTALLSACGSDHAEVHAVDKIAEAQKLAQEKAPKAEAVKFADHGETPMGGVGGAGGVTVPAPTPADAPKDQNTQEATDKPADSQAQSKPEAQAQDNTKPADTAPTDTKAEQTDSKDAKVATASAQSAPADTAPSEPAPAEPSKAQ